jgi:hypothetical protein
MSDIRVLPSGSDLIGEVHLLLPDGVRDLSKTLIVFPEKRPAHFLRKAIAEKIGGSFLPPAIFSMDSFVEHLCRNYLGLRRPLLASADAVALLHDIHLTLPEPLGGQNSTALDAFAPIALKIYEDLEELCTAQMPVKRMEEILSRVPFKELPVLASLYRQFYAAVEAKGFLTRGMMYASAADRIAEIDFSSYEQIILAGFFMLVPSEQKLFNHVMRMEQSIVFFQEGKGLQQQLESLGLSDVTQIGRDTPVRKPEIHLYECPDAHGQAFVLGGMFDAAIAEGKTPDERTVIALPAVDSLFPVLHHALTAFDEQSYNVSLGYPVSRTPVYGFLSTLFDLLSSYMDGRFEAAAYIKFVLHPYTKNIRWKERADVTRILFNVIEDEFIQNKTMLFFALEDIERNDDLISRIALRCHGVDESIDAEMVRSHITGIHDRTIRSVMAHATIGQFARRTGDVLRYVFEESTANLHPLFRPFAQTLLDVLESVELSLLADKTFGDIPAACAFLRTIVSSETVPFSGTPLQGLQVLGFLETRNVRFDTVYLLDANDDVLPGSKGMDVLLPVAAREVLGLRTYRTQEQISAYTFDLLIQGAQQVHCFYVQKGKKERSRFLEQILWEKQKSERTTETGRFIPSLSYALRLHGTKPGPVKKSSAMIESLQHFQFSATALDAYLHCGLKFYYRYLLRLQEEESADDEIETSEIGTFVHGILCDYYRKYTGTILTADLFNREALLDLIDQRFAEQYGTDPVGAAFLLKSQVRLKLLEFLERYQIPILQGTSCRLIDVEQTIDTEMEGIGLRGKIDRIEERQGATYIFDYKTSANDTYLKIDRTALIEGDRSTWPAVIGSLQLPFYAILYATHERIPLDSIIPAFIFLGRCVLDTSIEVPLFEKEGKEELEVYERIIMALLREIVSPEHDFLPTEDFENECARCEFCALCGTQWAV